MKKLLSLLSIIILIISSISFAEPNEKLNDNIERYLGMARVITYNKGDKSNQYAFLDGEHRPVTLGGTITFTNIYSLPSINRDPKKYKLISVESFNGSNFKFGSNAYNNKTYDEQSKNDFFSAQKGFLENSDDFYQKYSPFTSREISISNAKLTPKGVELSISTKLEGGLEYFKMFGHTKKQSLDYFQKLLGGSNIDKDASDALERIRDAKPEDLSKMSGYVFFIPYVITLEKIGEPDIVVFDGKYSHENNQLCYEYKVKLEGMEKVENVEVRDNNKAGEVIPLLEKDKVVEMKNCINFPDGKEVDIDIFVNPKKDNPKNEKTYDNNVYKVGDALDLEVTKIIVEKEYPADVEISVPVEVKNNSEKEITTEIDLNGKTKPVKLLPKDEAVVVFSYNLPKKGNVTLTAEINKKREIKEKNYENNKKSVLIKLKKDASTQQGGCVDNATWKEIDFKWHTATWTDSLGRTHSYSYKVFYDFIYQAKMTTSVSVTDDKGKQKNAVTTKSGYGFKVDTKSTIAVKQISGAWNRAPKQKPTEPNNAQVTTSWKVKKIHKQAQVIKLMSNGKGSFTVPVNSSSKTGAKVIYTDLDLSDGKHSITVRVDGSFIDGKELCTSKVVNINIKGNMYEDYKVS